MKYGPITLWFELETRCNIRCRFCYNHWKDGTHPAPRGLPTATLLDCLDRLLDEVTCDRVALSGGEPLMHPDLDQYLSFFHERGIPTVLTTNGTLLSDERLLSLRSRGLGAVQVPLHSAVPDVHDRLSGARCWRRSVGVLALARRLGIDTTPVFVATKMNLHSIEGVLELLYLLGIHRVIFNRFVPSGAGILNQDALDVTEQDILETLYRAEPVAHRLGTIVDLGVRVRLNEQQAEDLCCIKLKSCETDGMHRQFTLDAAGDLKHCNQSPYPLGNLQLQSFSDLARRLPEVRKRLARVSVQACYCASLEVGASEADVLTTA
jgi:MoaA/NifB/PqqE/SkfB family radical SAM enzyme